MPRDVIADPVTTFVQNAQRMKTPVPLISTDIDVSIVGGIAVVRTMRLFRNTEGRSIEATMTFPVPVSAAVTSLQAEIDGRRLAGSAKARDLARETYETALDDGQAAVLHEELLRGVHMVSVGQLGPGKEVRITAVFCMPLAAGAGDEMHVRIPTTVGDIYGTSPLSESDDLVHGGPAQHARIKVHTDIGKARLDGAKLTAKGAKISLDRPIDIRIAGWEPRPVAGRAADGRLVTVEIDRLPVVNEPIDGAVLLDDSSSMSGQATRGVTASKFRCALDGLWRAAQEVLGEEDTFSLWRFNSSAVHVGQARGSERIRTLIESIRHGGGSTNIGLALDAALGQGEPPRDVLLLTDGKSYALDVHELARRGSRVHVLLVGEDSLEATVGHLAALTGGQLFAVRGDHDIDAAMVRAFAAMRLPVSSSQKKRRAGTVVDRVFGGVGLRATWSKSDAAATGAKAIKGQAVARKGTVAVEPDTARMIGAFAASLRLTEMPSDKAATLAEAEGLCGHLTSLVLVDEAGEQQEGIPATRKVALPTPATALVASAGGGQFMASSSLAPSGNAASSLLRSAAPRLAALDDGMRTPSAWSAGADEWAGMPTVGGAFLDSGIDRGSGDSANWHRHLLASVSAPWPRLLALQIDWTSDPAALAQGDLSGLDSETGALLRSAARELCGQTSVSETEALRAILLVLAERQKGGDRSAARIARGLRREVSAALHDQVRKLAGTVGRQAA